MLHEHIDKYSQRLHLHYMKYDHVFHQYVDEQQPTINGYILMRYIKYAHVYYIKYRLTTNNDLRPTLHVLMFYMKYQHVLHEEYEGRTTNKMKKLNLQLEDQIGCTKEIQLWRSVENKMP